jgi:hypothetical protein
MEINAMANKSNAIVLTDAQKAFVKGASKAASLLVQTQAKGMADIAAVKEAAKKALEVQRTELNLNLKGLKETGFKMSGTMRTNPAKQAIFDGFVSGGQEKNTAANSLSVVVWCFDRGYMVETLEAKAMKSKASYKGLLDGKTIKVERATPSCAPTLIKSMEGAGFALIVMEAVKALGLDMSKVAKADEKAIAAFKLALVKGGYATIDAKNKLKATDKE